MKYFGLLANHRERGEGRMGEIRKIWL